MTNNRAIPFIIATLVSLIVWVAVAQWVMGESRQTCQAVHSVDICEWELR